MQKNKRRLARLATVASTIGILLYAPLAAAAPTPAESANDIYRYIVIFVNVLSGMVGIVVVIGIIAGGIQYSAAGADPQKVSAAKDRIRNAVIALIAFIFMWTFLNWMVPGGVLSPIVTPRDPQTGGSSQEGCNGQAGTPC